jgi:hypothetical protein
MMVVLSKSFSTTVMICESGKEKKIFNKYFASLGSKLIKKSSV